MTSSETRRRFLDYFAARRHKVVASSPLVLPSDPSLLFANAGMNQFKELFTGRERRDYSRATSSQKCLRVSGKHNDLEMVGRTPRHHTFFEMLGNFSFGDYFKEEAIGLAWDLITRELGLPAERLWITVFGGSERFEPDDEAQALWRDSVGVASERILGLGERDNFWRMGETGPCGPCSEIHYDLGEDLTSVDGPSTPATDERRFLEIWNLVFMQFEQTADGPVERLPAPSIDTGMGLERIVSVLQDKRSNYDTDLFQPILRAAAARAGLSYGEDPEKDFSLRVIADHARAFAFLVADGVVPANDRRGYVLRRLLRRAIRHGRKLGITEPFLHDVTPVVTEGLAAVYPELNAARDAILDVGRREEQRFADTLATGLTMLDQSLADADPGPDDRPLLAGKELFRLYDTFGFPLDLARDIADERGVTLDEDGFEAEMAKQRGRARASWRGAAQQEENPVYLELAASHPTTFVGYEMLQVDGVPISRLLREGQQVERIEQGREGEVILESTPFYAESGGQVGDTGMLVTPDGQARVIDVRRPAAGLIVQRVQVEAGALTTGSKVCAEVDEQRRDAIRRNHTATHLLHAALREVVGTHVKQAGSLVAAERLRFDFSHFAPVSERAQADIEAMINDRVLSDIPVETEEMDLDDALRHGAMALFGEKYGQSVRVVRIGSFSLELCGGTHTGRTGEIGLIKLTSERGISSGTRRIGAISGTTSVGRFRSEHGLIRALEEQLSVPRDRLVEEIARRLEHARRLQKRLERQGVDDRRRALLDQAAHAPRFAGVRVLAARLDGAAAQEARELADNLRQKLGSGVIVLGRADGKKVSLLVAVTDDLKARLPAGDLVKQLAALVGGRGGGRPDLAEAGGKQPEKLDEALQTVGKLVEKRLESAG